MNEKEVEDYIEELKNLAINPISIEDYFIGIEKLLVKFRNLVADFFIKSGYPDLKFDLFMDFGSLRLRPLSESFKYIPIFECYIDLALNIFEDLSNYFNNFKEKHLRHKDVNLSALEEELIKKCDTSNLNLYLIILFYENVCVNMFKMIPTIRKSKAYQELFYNVAKGVLFYE